MYSSPSASTSTICAWPVIRLGPLFFSVNVLEEPEIREGVKVFSNWPTIPQLYIRGEFIGGCDIMREMYQSGELKQLLEGIAAPD